MIEKSKLKSYVLLMAYDLQKIFEKIFGRERSDSINGQILTCFRKLGTNPINIYSWTPDWDDICNILNRMVKPLFRISTIESNSVLLLMNKWHIETEIIDVKTLSKRVCFIINKYHYSKSLFQMIYDNYKHFEEYHNSIDIGTEEFNAIILNDIIEGRRIVSSERAIQETAIFYRDVKKRITPTHEFIVKNLPFDLLDTINTTNENKISLFFQKGLAREMSFYLNFTKMSVTQKQYFLGWSFLMCQFIYNQNEFIRKKLAKDKYYEFEQSDYDEFLRTEGYNIYKTL
jgi:hypothetical protein